MVTYPVELTLDTNGSFLVDVVDIPEAHAVGEDEAEALRNAVEAIETALDMYAEQLRALPSPSPPRPGQLTVSLPNRATCMGE